MRSVSLCLCTLAQLSLACAFVAPQSLKQPVRWLSMKTEKKSEYTITLLPGDGIGPEIMTAALGSIHAAARKHGITLHTREADIGGIAIDKHGDPFPQDSFDLCRKADSVLLACIGGYKWDTNPRYLRPETGLLKMRKKMDLFANLRPAKVLPQLIESSTLKPEIVQDVDIMVVRELTGDVYFGEPKGLRTLSTGEKEGYNMMVYRETEIRRIAKVAMEVAMQRDKRVCSIDKANVLDVSALWRDVVTQEAASYPDVALTHMYVDNAAMQLIRWPRQFDVMVTGNLFGDILSDEASMLVGSLGMLPSASVTYSIAGHKPGVFEPCHGSAPDIAGTDKANPLAMILSAAMMFRYDLNQPEAANTLEKAVEYVLDKNIRTGDIYQEGCFLVGCKEMGHEVAEAVSQV